MKQLQQENVILKKTFLSQRKGTSHHLNQKALYKATLGLSEGRPVCIRKRNT